jgi:hypothetical protein
MAGGRRALGAVLAGLGVVALAVGVLGLAGVIGDGDGADQAAGAGERTDDRPATEADRSSPSTAVTTTTPRTTTTVATPATTGPTTTTLAAESPAAFFAAFAAAIRGRDTAFLVARLHPTVLERYSETACRTQLATIDQPRFDNTVVSVSGPAAWAWETDGLSRTLPDTLTVRVRSTLDGQSFTEQDAHVIVAAGKVLWFTDCGTPVAGAR